MADCPECDRFPPETRARQICTGTADISLERVNRFRAIYSLPPLFDVVPTEKPAVVVTVSRPPQKEKKTGCRTCGGGRPAKVPGAHALPPRVLASRGPGSELLKIFTAAGLPHCENCLFLAADMDGWGPLVCRSKSETIVADILPRALEWEKQNLGCMAKLIPTSVTKVTVQALVNRAILNAEAVAPTLEWAYGITTVSERKHDLFPRTLESLARAGFDAPRIFVDDDGDYSSFGLATTNRIPRVRTYGNWLMGLLELLTRNPTADRFAMFQDDLVACLGLREYLTRIEYPSLGYLNLYTFPSNERISNGVRGWYQAGPLNSGDVLYGQPQQTGYGAVGLVFSREAAVTLLQQQTTFAKLLHVKSSWRRVDGCIAAAMNAVGWREYVHSPSLLQHTGLKSSMLSGRHPLSSSFPGEDFDALTLLEQK